MNIDLEDTVRRGGAEICSLRFGNGGFGSHIQLRKLPFYWPSDLLFINSPSERRYSKTKDTK